MGFRIKGFIDDTKTPIPLSAITVITPFQSNTVNGAIKPNSQSTLFLENGGYPLSITREGSEVLTGFLTNHLCDNNINHATISERVE